MKLLPVMNAPDGYKSWYDYAMANFPQLVYQWIEEHGTEHGLNCRRLAWKAYTMDIIPLPPMLDLSTIDFTK